MSSTVWIWGRHSVLEALRAQTARTVWIAAGRKGSAVLDEIEQLAADQGVALREVAAAQVDQVAPGQNNQGVVASIVERRLSDVHALLGQIRASASSPFLLALDQIQDPHNLGALLRTADAAGVQGVVVPARRSAPVSGVVAKTSAGAVSYLPIVEVTNLVRAIDEVRAAGVWAIGLEMSGAQSLFSVDLNQPVLLVVGGEADGLRRLTRERCDLLVHLPMRGSIESLNASVAGSVAMYEVLRQRLMGTGAG